MAATGARDACRRSRIRAPPPQCRGMRGLLVVGTGLDSGETLVAAAACGAARAAGEDARLFVTAAVGPGAEAEAALAAAVDGERIDGDRTLRTAASPAIAA